MGVYSKDPPGATDNADALKLWRHIFGGERGLLAICHSGGLDDFSQRYFPYPKAAGQAAEWAHKKSGEGREVYFCAHLLTRQPRNKDNAAAVRTLWGDLDGADLPNGDYRPTAVVESSPRRYHPYWRLTDSLPPEVAEQFNERLAHAVGADPSGFDLSQLLRVPGTVNHKYPHRPPVRLLGIHSDHEYVPGELDELLPKPEKPQAPPQEEDGDEPPVMLDPEAMKVWLGEKPRYKVGGEIDRSASLLKIGRELYDRGATKPVIVAALAERDATLAWRCYTDRRDADKQYRAIVDELERNGRNGSKSPSANGTREKPPGNGKQQPPTHDELRDRWIGSNPDRAYGLGEWRAYERGTWPTVSETSVKGEIADEIEAAKPEGIKPTASILNSTTELARVKVYVPDERWDADDDVLVCDNGALRLSTRELVPHAKEHYATAGVPYAYARRATSEVWEERVMGELVAEHLGLGAVRFLQEYAGYCLTTSTEHEIAIWLTGKHGGGRSTILAGLEAMLGPRAGVLSLSDIERSTFALTNLPGKTLVTATEQPVTYLRGGGTLNAIISGEPIQVDRKYRDPITVVPRCKIAWAMNDLPRVGNMDDGIFRRVKIVDLPEIAPEKRDPRVKEQVKASGAGILNWALDGLDRLRDRGHFEVPATIRTATEEFKGHNDVPAMFVEDACERAEDASEAGASLYEVYRQWCFKHGHKPLASNNAAREWERLGFVKKRSSKGVRWEGVRLTVEAVATYGNELT